MTVFLTLLKDAYYQLNSKKLFWVTLALSGIVILVYASIGFNSEGMSMFFGLWTIETEYFSADSPLSKILYRSLFSTFIVGIWLAWIATILALISTTSIFPDFLADGSVDLVLSKPVGRLRLFFYKYLTSLLFVFAQVAIFCVGVFICMGWRIGDWDPKIFIAIPIILLFYSYLFSFNTFIGVWTRSALTALLLTMLLWFGIWSLTTSEVILNSFKTQMIVEHEREVEADPDTPEITEDSTYNTLNFWHSYIVKPLKFITPKTSETISIIERELSRDSDISISDLLNGRVEYDASQDSPTIREASSAEQEAAIRIEEEMESQSWWYIIGTSLGFEAIMLGLAALIFMRRDF